MKKFWIILTVGVLMTWMAMPALAAGPDLAPTASPRATATAVATTTPVPTYTPQATYTPFPTYTPQPTFTPLPTYTPTSRPTATATAAPTVVPTVESTGPGVEVGDENGKLIFGGAYTLRSGEQIGGSLVVFGGDVTLEEGSRVNGDVAVIGGSVDIAGRVEGDLALIGGTAHLRSSAVVGGQVVRVGGALRQEPGAQIYGGESEGVPLPPVPPVPPVPRTRFEYWPWSGVNVFFDLVWHMMRTVGTTIVLAVLAAFVVTLWREPTERVSRAITNAAAASWGVGMLTVLAFAVIAPAFAVLSAILVIACGLGLLGLGILGVAALALMIGWLMGWIALGWLVGERLLDSLNAPNATPAMSAAIGTAVITLLWMALEPVCGLGWLFFAVLGPLGLGAVVLTRAGSQSYGNGIYTNGGPKPPAPPSAPVAPAAPEPPQFSPVKLPEPPAPPLPPTPPSSEPSVSPLDKPVGEV